MSVPQSTPRFRGLHTLLVLLFTAVSAGAAERHLVIAGAIFEDRLALAIRPHFVPAPGVELKAYRDGGDGVPTADDRLAGSARTSDEGIYLFEIQEPGDYWVTVDSRSFAGGKAWAEETFGPAGSLCARRGAKEIEIPFESPCFSGRSATRSDDASSLVTAEHLAKVHVVEPVTGVDFAFSFDVVTTAEDGETIQGSFRQFLKNARLPGPNRMRFVPIEYAPEQHESYFGPPPRWWRITAVSPFPAISDPDTVVDGTAFNFLSASSLSHANPGRIGEAATIKPGERSGRRVEKPDLELLVPGAEGLVCVGRCGIRGVSIHGAAIAVVVLADARLEDVVIGAAPDGEPFDEPAQIGLRVDRGMVTVRQVFITGQSVAGIVVAQEGRLDAAGAEITRCGKPESGGGVLLQSSGSSIRASTISANLGTGVILGALDGSAAATGNTVDSSTITANESGIVLGPGASRNTIARNDIIWNRLGGVTVARAEGKQMQRANRLSANRFDENGSRPIVLNLDAEDPNQLAMPDDKCQLDTARANDGIAAPRVTNVHLVRDDVSAIATIRGTACPGQIVELYQSFITSGIRETGRDVRSVRNEKQKQETITTDRRTRSLPSIAEFNYLGATNTAADGTFVATFSLAVIIPLDRIVDENDEAHEVWASQVLHPADASERAFSAIAIDPAGNTSEMSIHRGVDDVEGKSR